MQPFVDAPFTTIASDGSWTSSTFPWTSIVVLLVDPTQYTPAATKITNPALDAGVLASTSYPAPSVVSFSGRTWGIKTTGNVGGDQFDPGPNFWSNDPSVVSVVGGELHLKIGQINGNWQCGEVYLAQSLGYGTYTVQVASRLDQLDRNTVAAPLFLYTDPSHEVDNEYSGLGGLVGSADNGQFVVQPYTIAGNFFRYTQSTAFQFTSQIEWASDHITFTTWNGWSSDPAAAGVISQWTYKGSPMGQPGSERVHMNLWLNNGAAPSSGSGDEMIIHSFAFQPANSGTPSINNGGIVPIYSTATAVEPGEWVSIYGKNLAGSAMPWSGDFPILLGGTSVTIDGKPAYLSFVSPTQINLQVPDDTTRGSVPVVVQSGGGTANATVSLVQFAPSLLMLDSKHVAGIILRNDGSGAYGGGKYDILGPTGTSLGYAAVAAKAGDVIELFGTGFGQTSPAVPAGQVFSGASPTTNTVNVLINNMSVQPRWAGLSGAGLDQINLTVPAGAGTGDVPIMVTVGGAQTQSRVVISLQ